MRKESIDLPDWADLPDADELVELSRLRDREADAKRAYDRAVADASRIFTDTLDTITQIDSVRQTLAQQTQANDAASAEADTWRRRIDDLRSALEAVTARMLGNVGTEVPLLLLPVRLETRFEYRGDADTRPQALKIRIYPDDIHVDSHETGLSIDEEVWGRNFAAMTGRAASDAERFEAWRVLSGRFGARRAAWIAAVHAKRQ